MIAAFLMAAAWSGSVRAEAIPFFAAYPQLDFQRWYVSHGWANGEIQSCEWRKEAITVKGNNLVLTLSDKGGEVRPVGCAEIHTNATSGYGLYEARLRSAAGSGLNTAFFTYIGPGVGAEVHDEIDFEFLGKNPRSVQLNYYVKGKPQDGTIIPLPFDASAEFHDYAFAWEPDRIRWYIDGKQVHETKPGAAMPIYPGRIYITLWSGSKQVDDWLGSFTYKSPVSAEFAWVKYTPMSPGK